MNRNNTELKDPGRDARELKRKNEIIRKRNRIRIGVFSVLLIFALIGLGTVIGKLPIFNKKTQEAADDRAYMAKGGDVQTEVKEDDVRKAMEGVTSKEGYTDKLQKILIVKDQTDLYTAPDSKSGTSGKLEEGEYVNFYGSEDGWYKLSTKNFEGYGKAEYFEEAEDSQFKIVDGVIIVNKDYSVPEDYEPGLSPEASQSFNLMKADMERDNMIIDPVSDFRSYEDQKALYEDDVDEMGQGYAEAFTARAGHSEHQLGLAIDVTNDGGPKVNPDFKATKESDWLEENAHKYGFIIRYPKGKKDVTGYEYEPWHLRYLGPDKAKEIYDSGLTIEEYYGL